ncbi:N-dimethylarginine dimethylaminohydrolase [Actinoplanes xinjiangensis]|uniref:N-dimethylarginine dimethylaminohydrolase n=2 Tax=Actinoplanes xinjiangensis TaxID=512350 RepID=A0A316EUU9_9ACTN|nr:N-dimethylarginine dimethylaminohydrolase [Actinoplanes xinjiangensis]GIF43268.1 amidinotransferase [Actinoplanes xinjiangensis]
MCPPEHFTVEYAINPWMDTTVAVDAGLALKQWEQLRTTLTGLGHVVHVLDPEPGLPDMVYSANGAFSVDGTVYGARFLYPQRAAEAVAHQAFYLAEETWKFIAPEHVNEGEGDFAYLPGAYGGIVLAGYGFRTEPSAHAEAQEVLGRPVVSLRLVDPAFYHLDTALAALDDRHVTYYPGAFSPASQRVLAQLFPDAVLADREDAEAFGLNLVSDGRNVILNTEAVAMGRKVRNAGYLPVHVDLSELKRGGGSVKCAVAELRP